MPIDLITTFGVVGSIASVVGLLLPATGWRTKAMHVLYGIAISILAVGVNHYQGQLSELTRIETQAKKLVNSRHEGAPYSHSNDRGFILAALTFFEKYRERFPETYQRAKLFSENAGVLMPITQGSYSDQSVREKNLGDGADAMESLLVGVASGGVN